jgi:putative transposase
VEYRSNSNVVYACQYHVVWCPKYRRKVLVGPIETRLKEIIREVIAETDSDLVGMEVMSDHVHLLVGCDPQFGINRLIRSIKGRSSSMLRKEFPALKSRLPSLWTNSYFVSSTGRVSLDAIKKYIENQKNV